MFKAIEAGDDDAYRACVSETSTVWTNFDDRHQQIADVVRTLGWLRRHVHGLRYDIVRRESIAGGVVQQHVLRGRAGDGTEIAMPACVWCTIEDGLVTSIAEYLDPSGLSAAMTS